MGIANTDQQTGIAYGVIPHNRLGEKWYEKCQPVYENDHAHDMDEPERNEVRTDSLVAVQSNDSPYVVVSRSPFYTLARRCSPCFPNAGDLTTVEDGDFVKTYCFGHDWFDKGVAPYMVYSVKDDQLVASSQEAVNAVALAAIELVRGDDDDKDFLCEALAAAYGGTGELYKRD